MMNKQERPDADRYGEYDIRPVTPDEDLPQEMKDSMARRKTKLDT
jgi:hypothetical protein